LVRVRGIDDPDVSLLLDNGAMGWQPILSP